MPDGAMDEVFGHMPRRPEHPDFWKLSEILLKLDTRMDEAPNQDAKDKVWKQTVSEVIDLGSLTYVAFQRAIRRYGITTSLEVAAKFAEVAATSSVWLDGFMAGAEFAKEKK